MKAAGYIRVSTTEQAEKGSSLAEQEAAIRDRIEAEGWELVEVFTDAGVSGRVERPELERLLDSLDSLDVIVITKADRLGRKAAELLALYERLQAAGVRLLPLGDPDFDSDTASGRLLPKLLAVLADFESEQLGERVKRTAAHNAKAGQHHGRAPFGYRSKGGQLVPVEAQATIVRRIFEEANEGKSQREIQRKLNADGVKPRQAKEWTQASVRGILINPTYAGKVPFGDEVYDGQHEGLVSAELFDKVAAARERNTRSRKGGPGRSPAGPHLFTRGLLRCGHCGEAMLTRTDPGRKGGRQGKRREEYKCQGREKRGPKSCPQTPVPRKPIDGAAFAYFQRVGIDIEETQSQLQAAIDRGRAEVATLLDAAEGDEAKAAEAVSNIRGRFTAGEITVEEWRDLKPDLEEQHAAATAKLTQARAKERGAEEADENRAEVEQAVIAKLAAIKAAVAGEVSHSTGIDAIRLGLRRAFDAFYIYRMDALQTAGEATTIEERSMIPVHEMIREESISDGTDWIVWPHPREDVLEGVGLPLDAALIGAADNDSEGFGT